MDHYSNYQRYQPGRYQTGGTLERKSSGGGGGGVGGDQIDSYRPPPPLSILDDQQQSTNCKSASIQNYYQQQVRDRLNPNSGMGPKTLESLAERVHPFYGLQGGPPGGGGGQQQSGRASTLDRRGGGSRSAVPGSSTTSSLMRGTRLTRSGSDQRIPASENEFYDYSLSSRVSSYTQGQGPTKADQAAARLGLTHRRRTSIDYASDTEASVRGYGGGRSSSRSGWKPPPPLLGLTPTTPSTPYYSHQAPMDSRSNSLPRSAGLGAAAGRIGTGGGGFRREVHFLEQPSSSTSPRPSVTTGTSGLIQLHHPQLDCDDSDGAVSAPELSEKQKQLQRLTQQQQQLLYGVRAATASSSVAGVHQPTGNFTSAEYKAWMQRAPSTSAIYERLRQGRQQQQQQQSASASVDTQRSSKLTFSAENLVEKQSKQQQAEQSYYSYRTHLTGSSNPASASSALMAALNDESQSLLAAARAAGNNNPPTHSGNSASAVGTSGSCSTSAPTSNDPRFKLLEINPSGK